MTTSGGGMKALQIVGTGRPVAERSVERPEPGPGEVLIRVRASGVCHSDAHYRAGSSPAGPLPLTPGHEVAGSVVRSGPGAHGAREGDRVCLHYLATCGSCRRCASGEEQFCPEASMLGKSRSGGWAEYVRVPARNAVALPDSVSFPDAAVMMCSTATAYHALRRARLEPGERVAVFGAGGLGLSAVQLARVLGARRVFAVDVRSGPLEAAGGLGATPVRWDGGGCARRIREEADGGVDVALEVAGRPETARAALDSLAPMGRAALAGIFPGDIDIRPYGELIRREAELVGVSDHLRSEIPDLLEWAEEGALRLDPVIRRTVPLEAGPVNETLDRLEDFRAEGRTVIVP